MQPSLASIDHGPPTDPVATLFHPAVAGWFTDTFGAPTEAQRRAWPAIRAGRDVLIAAPTGSGKTLAAFLSAIDDLVLQALAGGLSQTVQVVYVSPLKALSNDIHRNLEAPLAGIRERLRATELGDVEIRAAVRTGDTDSLARARMRRQPPHILVTTPESLFILLTTDSGRRMLASTRSVIVDELHAVAETKRGAHLALTLERLAALCAQPPVRIGLSATIEPVESMARLLVGDRPQRCAIVDTGHRRVRDLALELPRSPLTAVMATEVWDEIYDRLAELVTAHRTTLIFVNQRRQAERVARHLAERLGEQHVTAHHGSLAKEHRLHAERRLKAGQLKALVATASLELGIDIGDVDLVCQLGSPRSINAFLQRVGRSGHAVRATPRGRLFPLSLDDLAECAALLDGVERGELDRLETPRAPLDVLAQQITAECACREWGLQELHARFSRAWPYRELPFERFEAVVQMLADGYSTRRGRRGALVHYDRVNGVLRGRRGARLIAVTNAGTIPDQFDYDVELAPEGLRIGTLNEDFAFESLPGDIVQLGNASYRILKIETGRVIVEDAKGQPPNLPFWFGEAPARSDELSNAVSRLRAGAERVLREDGAPACAEWLAREYRLAPAAAEQLTAYLAAAHAALGTLPTRETLVLERFFDEVGDTHLVIHAPLGARVLRAFGLALRKRFCRQFNFELQAAALEDSLVLSLGPTHSFPLEDVPRFLHPASARDVLVQALLQAPMFATRWRWAASIALAIARNRNGKRVPPQFQRADAEDLLTHAFPDAVACQDNRIGEIEIPRHPLVEQALDDCLHEGMDVDGFLALLERIESGGIRVVCRDLTAPSPLSGAILSARPYAFLDDGAAEERRTRSVSQRAFEPDSAADLGRLDPAAIARVREELTPDPTNADELHDALVVHGFLTEAEIAARQPWRDALFAARRAARVIPPGGAALWVAAERLAELRAALPAARVEGQAPALGSVSDAEHALHQLVRSRMELLGPTTAAEIAAPLGLPASRIQAALLALEAEGAVMRGDFSGRGEPEWCERRGLARIHRYTREARRAEFEPVPVAAFVRFLCDWHGLTDAATREGPAALEAALAQLEGFPIAAAVWESEILPARIHRYDPAWLDALCMAGRITWLRLPEPARERKAPPVRATPIVLLPRAQAPRWTALACEPPADEKLSSAARSVLVALDAHGASFFTDLAEQTGLLRSQLEAALGELVSHGRVTADGFAGLRALVAPAEVRARRLRRGGLAAAFASLESAGRWVRVRASVATQCHDRRNPTPGQGWLGRGGNEATSPAPGTADTPISETHPCVTADDTAPGAQTEYMARVLLCRYGIVFRKLIERESWLPPWRALHYAFSRLEARGEIRGGRFVSGFSGEQFALPEATGLLRRQRDSDDPRFIVIGGCDPLNLTGGVLPGERVPALPGNRVLLRGGVPVAARVGSEFRLWAAADAATAWTWRKRLWRAVGAAAPKLD